MVVNVPAVTKGPGAARRNIHRAGAAALSQATVIIGFFDPRNLPRLGQRDR